MPTDTFLSELSNLSVEEWQMHCLRRFGTERLAGGAREALQIATDTFLSVLREAGETVKTPRLLLLDEFLRETLPPPPAIADEILPSKKLIILGGAPKEGKGLLGLEILHSVAAGLPVMDRFDVLPLCANECVVYLGMEDGAVEIKSRLERRGAANLPFYICADAFDMSKPEGMALFRQMMAELPQTPVLVVIDSLRKAYPSIRDYNDAAQVAPHIYTLCDWAHENCTVILVHHTNKNQFATGVNRLSGSNAVASSADGYMVLFDKDDSEPGVLYWKLEAAGRGGIGGSYRLQGDMETYKIRVMNSEEEQRAERQEREENNQAVCEQVYKYAQSARAVTVQMVSDVLQIRKDAAQRRIYELVEMGALKKAGKNGKAVTYSPASDQSFASFFPVRVGTVAKKKKETDASPEFIRQILDEEEV